MSFCKLCGIHNDGTGHEISLKHIKNKALSEYSKCKRSLVGNRYGIHVSGYVQSSFSTNSNCVAPKIQISTKPGEAVKFRFTIFNETKKDNIDVAYIQLMHSNLNFSMNNHTLQIGGKPKTLGPKAKLGEEVYVSFKSSNIGQYETTIVFYFLKQATNRSIVVMRDLVVFVEERQLPHEKKASPYALKDVFAETLFKGNSSRRNNDMFSIPPNYKHIFATNLAPPKDLEMVPMIEQIRKELTAGPVKDNYITYFHNLLWYEETIVRLNLKKYNMSSVDLNRVGDFFTLKVPGLAEKRPSLMLGDLLFVKPTTANVMFEATIKEINDNEAMICGFDTMLYQFSCKLGAKFDIRFFMSRIPLERMHQAVHNLIKSGQETRVFPKESPNIKFLKPDLEFFNDDVAKNMEQRCAVEHIVCGTSGTAPYLLHGPPGTGKTITVVEAILQLVKKSDKTRVLVCTDSNMAADHVATVLIQYAHVFPFDKLILRANSEFRVWETLPESLEKFSNGTCRRDFYPVTIDDFKSYHIVITTLSHAAKYARELNKCKMDRHITHLFIDEAAQASEPSCLVPVTGLLSRSGQLVLAGDPHQLGPVVISKSASEKGLGKSLMERLIQHPLYMKASNNPNYIVMLRNNFRSNPDILDIPDQLFYGGQLRPLAGPDALSKIDILGEKMTSRAVVFHGVLSREQKMGKSPSFFNTMEAETVKMYVKYLVTKHKVAQEDIGIVTPYIRQVYHIKRYVHELGYNKIEVGTVEAFQGKEKRVIVISTVRGNCKLLAHDAKFQLGFLVDDKRFNVAITRAKAKLVIIGNPLCLMKDTKWELFMQKCRDLGTYLGFDHKSIQTDNSNDEVLDKVNRLVKELSIEKENEDPNQKNK